MVGQDLRGTLMWWKNTFLDLTFKPTTNFFARVMNQNQSSIFVKACVTFFQADPQQENKHRYGIFLNLLASTYDAS